MAVVDDMDATGYTATSGFNEGAYIGHNGFRHHAYGDSTGDKATWSFTGLAAGTYRVSTTWTAASANTASAPYTIRSGGAAVGTATVDQRTAPNDAQISGTWWEDLGTGIFTISGGDLTIEVADQTTGHIIADAVRVEPWSGPEMHVITGDSKVDDNSGTVNFGTAASWWNVEKSFTVRNAGVDSPLTLGTLSVPTGFTLVSGLGSQTLQPGETTSFTVRLDTSSLGAKSGQVSLVTNDGNENPFNFTVNGTVNNFQVIDDQDATGFTYSSGFGSGAYIGYNSYRHHANGDNTGDKATWTFNNIPAGTYRISGTWTSAPSNTAAAPFSVRSNGLVVGTALVNQRSEPNDAQSQGAWWEDLGTGIFTVATGTLSVEVSDQTMGYVIADAIRIEPWTGPEVHVIATGGIKVDDNSGVIDYGTAANWWNVDKTFTVSNAGVGSALTLGSLSIPAGFTLVSGLGTQTLQPGESTSFIVRLDTSATGTKNGQISLATNDGNENPFNFTVKGVVNNYQIVDDLDPSLFSSTSGFANGAYLGYNTYFHYAYGDGSGDKATWTFNDLPPGTYRVSGTWPAASYASAAAPFTIRAGGSTIGTSAQNQQVAPNDFQSAGVWWEDLGTASYSVGSSPLTVEARDQTSNMVMADAIRIELLNAAPAAGNDQISVHGWNATTVPAPGVLANDTDREGAALTLTTVTPPQHGTLTWQTGGGFIYTPARDGATSDSFQYRVSDGTSNSSVATVELTFTGLNTAPVATTIANRTGDEDGTFDPIALRDFFADLEDSDDLLTYTATSPSSNLLELAIDDSTDNLLLNLVANAHGTAEVTVTATDTGGRSATTVFTVTVNSVNDAPSLANRLVTLDPANLLTGQQVGHLVVTDLDAETHTFAFTGGNENGGLTIDSTGRIFVADAEAFDFAAHGPYEYTLQVTDGAAAVTTAQLALANTNGFSITGPTTAGQNETYTVELNGGVSFAEWTIDWGDGAVSVVPGNAVSASHVYQSPTAPNITATISVTGSPVSAVAPGGIDVVQNEGVNLLINGGFEADLVTTSANWDVFPIITGWQYGYKLAEGVKFELHRGAVTAADEGDQSIELDADESGPNDPFVAGEVGSMGIMQYVATIPGVAYDFSFLFAARSDAPSGDNALAVQVTGLSTLVNETVSSTATVWIRHKFSFIADSYVTQIRLDDAGSNRTNTMGALLDDVQLKLKPASPPLPQFDLDVDGDNNNWQAMPEGSDWEEKLEESEYALGKLVIQSDWTTSFAPLVVRLEKNLDPDDPNVRLKLQFAAESHAGKIEILLKNKSDNPSSVDLLDGGDAVLDSHSYSLKQLGYDTRTGQIKLYINGVAENPLLHTMKAAEAWHKPNDKIKATLVKGQGDLAVTVRQDSVRYLVVRPGSFYYVLQFDPAFRMALASRGVYDTKDLPDFAMQKIVGQDLVNLALPISVTSLLGGASAKQVLYRDFMATEGAYVLAFAGTEDVYDIGDNIWQGTGLYSPRYTAAVLAGNDLVIADAFDSLTFTGHSLGGGLASAAAVASGKKAVTFNAAGLKQETFALRDGNGEILRDTNNQLQEMITGIFRSFHLSSANVEAYYLNTDLLSIVQANVTALPLAYGTKTQLYSRYSLSSLASNINHFKTQYDGSPPVFKTMVDALPEFNEMVNSHKINAVIDGLFKRYEVNIDVMGYTLPELES